MLFLSYGLFKTRRISLTMYFNTLSTLMVRYTTETESDKFFKGVGIFASICQQYLRNAPEIVV